MVEERLVAPEILTFSVQCYSCLLVLIPQTTNLVKRPGENNNHSHGQTLCQGNKKFYPNQASVWSSAVVLLLTVLLLIV